tara:strand:- start:265 stop:474 length:210 start_codon:yes stop_codon:yes gene_type:complete
MNNTYNRLLNLVTETGPVKRANKAKMRAYKKEKQEKENVRTGTVAFDQERAEALDKDIKRNSPPGTPGR